MKNVIIALTLLFSSSIFAQETFHSPHELTAWLQYDANETTLRWALPKEVNTNYFLVQILENGTWESIYKQAASKHTCLPTSYQFIFTPAKLEAQFYRIVLVELGGLHVHSNVVEVQHSVVPKPIAQN